MLEREKKKSKLIWHDKLGCGGLAAKHTPHFSLILLCNRTTGRPGTFAYSSLAPTSKRPFPSWGMLANPNILVSLKTGDLSWKQPPPLHYFRQVSMGGMTAICTPSSALAASKTPDWSQITWNKGPDTLLLDRPVTMSFLKLQLWEETKTASELQSHSSTLSKDQLLQEEENFPNPVKEKRVILQENRRKIAALKEKHSKK